MKRKLCSVLLALCMVLTLLPVSAMAEDGTLQSQIDAIETTGTVTLDKSYTEDISIPAGKTITLDLAGHTLTNVSSNTITNSGTLTITGNGTVDNVTHQKAAVMNNVGGTVTIKNGKFTRSAEASTSENNSGNNSYYVIDNYGTMTVNNGTFMFSDTNAGLYSSLIHNGWYDGSKNTSKAVATMTINSGDFTKAQGGKITVKNDDYGNLTINGGNFTQPVNNYYCIFSYNVANITGGTINGHVGSSGVADSDADKGQLTISGDVSITGDVDALAGSNVSISGGTIGGTAAAYNAGKLSISGGTFSNLKALDSLASGANVSVKLATNVDKTVSIPAGATVALDLKGHDIAVTSGCAIVNKGNLTVTGSGKVSTTASESAAVANFPGATATLKGGDYTSDVWYIIKNLGEMLIDGPVSIAKPADNTNTASLIDNGWVNSSDTVASESVAAQAGKASLTIKSGNFNGSSGAKSCSVVKNDDYGTLNISGGTFDSTNNKGADNAATILNWNVATISGGTFTGLYPLSNGAYTGEADKGLLTVTGGNFVGTRTIFGNGIGGNGKGAVTISGGTFTAPALGAIYDNVEGGYTVSISGGTYTVDPSAYVVPGYVVSNNGSTYTVYYPVPVTPGNTSSSTTKNPDGSTTTTTTDKTTGTVTETTKNPDGSTTTVETKKDGSVTATNKTANGSVGTVKTDANGNSEISASISAADVNAAAKKNEPVAAPVSVAPAASSAAAPVIKLSVPASAGEVSVVIPVVNAQQGTVAIKVNPDGTEEIIKTSVVTKDGVVLGVKGSTQIKIVNNDKDFADTVGHWAESDVDFVSARELFTGTAPQTFSPEAATTRGMVVTVLARLAGESTDGGANWYDKGCAWAVTNGVSDGTDPNGTVTREQLAAMLYRYFGSPAVSGSLSFADASSVSEYAHDAMQWCVNNGIINGMDGLLNPQGQATRAQVSAMFARYIRLMSTK